MKVRFALTVAVLVGLGFSVGSPLVAWNKAGHMTSAALAYQDLQGRDPEALRAVVDLLKEHPFYEDTWKNQVSQPFVPEEERNLYLFMLARDGRTMCEV